MNQTIKKSKTGPYLLAGLGVLVLAVAVLVFAGGGNEGDAPAPDEPIAGSPAPADDDNGSCLDYAAALGELNAKYESEITSFWQTARDGAQEGQTVSAVRQDSNLQNYDVELNALRAEYGLAVYSLDNSLTGQPELGAADYCQTESAQSFASETEKLRQVFDLDGHYQAFADLNEQHQLAEFVSDNNVPHSTGPWAPPLPDGTPGEPLVDWTDEQRQAVLADAEQHRLSEYFSALDQLAEDYNIGTFESLLTDLEVRYNLSPSWLVQGGELILLSHVYSSDSDANAFDSDITYFTLGHIRWLLEEPDDNE